MSYQAEFDADVAKALEKWPNVPASYGWLTLDRRGNWGIKSQRISHLRAIAFLNRNYSADEEGRWFVQNGPQRAYCDLAYTPWIYRLDVNSQLLTHTDLAVKQAQQIVVDEDGNLLVETEFGIGLLDDRDLGVFLNCLQTNGRGDAAELLAACCEHAPPSFSLEFGDRTLPVVSRSSALIAQTYRFIAKPKSVIS